MKLFSTQYRSSARMFEARAVVQPAGLSSPTARTSPMVQLTGVEVIGDARILFPLPAWRQLNSPPSRAAVCGVQTNSATHGVEFIDSADLTDGAAHRRRGAVMSRSSSFCRRGGKLATRLSSFQCCGAAVCGVQMPAVKHFHFECIVFLGQLSTCCINSYFTRNVLN